MEKLVKLLKKYYCGYNFIYFIVFITFIVFSFSLTNDFNIDDQLYINNRYQGQPFIAVIKSIFTQPTFVEMDGVQHEYRPVAAMLFFMEYRLFGMHPFVGHAINLLLYLFLIWGIWHVLFFRLAAFYQSVLRISILIFAIHPIHAEVVCSIKAREELYVILFGFAALYFLYQCLLQSKPSKYGWMLLFFLLALLCKKSGLLFLPIFVLFHYLWSKQYWSKQTLFLYAAWLMTSVVYIFIHDNLESTGRVLFFYENPLISNTYSFEQKAATSLFIIGKYAWMQIYPHPLSCYYGYPVIPILSFSSILPWMSLCFFGLLVIFGWIWWRNKNPFGAIGLALSVTVFAISNIIEPIPGLFADRLAFMPSLFFVPLFCVVVLKILKSLAIKKSVQCLVIVSFATFLGVSSFSRTFDWKDSSTLFMADLKSYPNNLRLLTETGNVFIQAAKEEQLSFEEKQNHLIAARKNIDLALLITPNDFKLKQVKAELDCLTGKDSACAVAMNSGVLPKPFFRYYESLTQFYEKKQDTLKIIFYLEKAIAVEPGNLKIYEQLNRLYFLTNKTQNGIDLLQNVIRQFPNSPLGYAEMANYYLSVKDTLKALPFIEAAAIRPPKNPAVIQFLIDYYSHK